MNQLLSLLGFAWCAPISLVGLLFSPGSRKIRDTAVGARVFYAGPMAQWLLKTFHARAMTLGWFIYSRTSVMDAETEAHEAHHVEQQMRQGPFFALGYYGVMPLLLALGLGVQRDHPYEIAARRAAGGQ